MDFPYGYAAYQQAILILQKSEVESLSDYQVEQQAEVESLSDYQVEQQAEVGFPSSYQFDQQSQVDSLSGYRLIGSLLMWILDLNI